jgi:hypothetical protein
MTNEEMQRAMEFIVEQEARTSAKLNALAQSQAEAKKEADERWARADERWARTEESIRTLLSIAKIHEREIGGLGEQIGGLSEQIASLTEAGRATDERLNVLINIVDRHISEGRNGKP